MIKDMKNPFNKVHRLHPKDMRNPNYLREKPRTRRFLKTLWVEYKNHATNFIVVLEILHSKQRIAKGKK